MENLEQNQTCIPVNAWSGENGFFRSDSEYIHPGLSFFGSAFFLWKSQETGLVVSLRSLVALPARPGLDDSN